MADERKSEADGKQWKTKERAITPPRSDGVVGFLADAETIYAMLMTARQPIARRARPAAFLMHYPYLHWWVQHYGYLQMGSHDDFGPGGWLTVADDEGICYQARALDSVDEALRAAEHHLQTVVFPERFADSVIQQVEVAALRQRWE